MRGIRSLSIAPATNSPQGEKGRIAVLRQRRDRKLAARYYYYNAIHRLNYKTIIESLSFEFDISDRRLIDVLEENRAIIQEFRLAKATIKHLRDEFPFLMWKEPAQLSLF